MTNQIAVRATTAPRILHKLNLVNVTFFGALLLLTLTALPWYVLHVGVSRVEWVLFWSLVIATGLSITVGYHRLFAHRAFQGSRPLVFLSLLFGAAAFEQSALMWASQHRDHHRYVDTDDDPYNIKRGFWFAHIGWFLFWEYQTDYSNVTDLQNDPLVMHQHRHYAWWAISAGIVLPLVIGAVTGHVLGALLLCTIGRLTVVHHSTFSINSICHTFGKATYDINASARDHWLVAFLTNGEGYHNFHHRFASDYRNGVRWYHWDPSKWLIQLFAWVGLARRLHRVPSFSIEAARVAGERQRVEQDLLHRQRHTEVETVLTAVRQRYAHLKTSLHEWERCAKEYRALKESFSEKSREMVATLLQQIADRRQAFAQARREWVQFINTHPIITRGARI